MDLIAARAVIEAAWETRAALSPEADASELRAAVATVLDALDRGEARVATKGPDGVWTTHGWLKQAVLLSFRLHPNVLFASSHVPPGASVEAATALGSMSHCADPGRYWDKVALKTAAWTAQDFAAAGFRCAPPATVRRGAFVGAGAVLMPSYVNIGAYVGEDTMIDTWATVGSCAQIGARCHISGGVGIGGVLEPLQANPVIIEDDVFIGARSEVAEGVIVREGAVLSMGVYLGASTKIVDRETGAITRGEVPPFAVVVPGALPDAGGGPSLYCAVIVKRVDAQTRAKTAINELLRA